MIDAKITFGLIAVVCIFVSLFDLGVFMPAMVVGSLLVAALLYHSLKSYKDDRKISHLVLRLVLVIYLLASPLPQLFKGYQEYSEAYSLKRPRCEAGDAEACKDVGSIQVRNGMSASARNHYFVACQLGNDAACDAFNERFIRGSDMRLSLVLYTARCAKGDTTACRMNAQLLKEIADDENDPKALELSCGQGNGSACYDLGHSYEGTNIIETEKYYRKACENDKRLCWTLQYSCKNLNDIADKADAQHLKESLAVCDSLCKNDKVGCDFPERYYNERAEAFDNAGEIAEAYEYSHLACALRKSDAACLITKHACANYSFTKFRKRSPNQADIDRTLKLCDEDCTSGNSLACGGIGSYYQESENWRDAFLYYKKECDLNLSHCSLIKQCAFRLDKFVEQAKSQTEKDEFTKICERYSKLKQ